MLRIIVDRGRPEIVDVLRRGTSDMPGSEVIVDRRRAPARPAHADRRQADIAAAIAAYGWTFVSDRGPVHAQVLVIDDHPDIRQVVAEILDRAGYGIQTAPDGEAGVDIARHTHPDAVVVDIFMPLKDGIETIRELRRQPHRPKIIAMSAGWSAAGRRLIVGPHAPDVLEDARLAGADAVLTKPISRETLCGTLEMLLRGA